MSHQLAHKIVSDVLDGLPDLAAALPDDEVDQQVKRLIQDALYAQLLRARGASPLPHSDAVRRIQQCLPSLRGASISLLGSVHEHLRGQTLRVVGGQLMISAAPTQRKDGGVFYTPEPVVSYIVGAVLDPLLQDGSAALRVMDPSCGAGRFLLQAYSHLLDRQPGLPPVKRAALLQASIFGVDIDPEAVEIAIRSLYLKLLEGGPAPLPDLRRNIFCADAIQCAPEALPEGIDAIVGNPPYIKEYQNKSAFEALRASRHALLYRARMDLAYAFTGLGLERLRPGGRLGLITPNNWPQSHSAAPLRSLVREQSTVEALVDFHDRRVFPGASIQTMIHILRKEPTSAPYTAALHRLEEDAGQPLGALLPQLDGFASAAVRIDPRAGGAVMPLAREAEARVLDAMAAAGGFQIRRDEVGQGIIGGPDAAFLHEDPAGYRPAERALLRPHYTSCGRFQPAESAHFIAYLTPDTAPTLSPEQHPNLWAKLALHREKLSGRREVQRGRLRWYHLHWPRSEALFKAGPKLACSTRVRAPRFAVVEEDYYASRAVNMVVTERVDVHYLCGVLNSSAVHFWLRARGKRLGSMLQLDTGFLLGVPIPAPGPRTAEIARLSRALHQGASPSLEAELDAQVWALYRLDAAAVAVATAALRRAAR